MKVEVVVTMVSGPGRLCEYSGCERGLDGSPGSLEGRDARARYCDHVCRRAASRAREAARGRQEALRVRAHGLGGWSSTQAAVRMRERRDGGPVPSDKRIQYSAAVAACAAALRTVAAVSEANARAIAHRAMAAALPPSQRDATVTDLPSRPRVSDKAAA